MAAVLPPIAQSRTAADFFKKHKMVVCGKNGAGAPPGTVKVSLWFIGLTGNRENARTLFIKKGEKSGNRRGNLRF